jgi:hypothetical protein
MKRFLKVWSRDAWVDMLTGEQVSAMDVHNWKYRRRLNKRRPVRSPKWGRFRFRWRLREKDIARAVRPLPTPWKRARN